MHKYNVNSFVYSAGANIAGSYGISLTSILQITWRSLVKPFTYSSSMSRKKEIKYAAQLKRFSQALIIGTPENAIRKSYPGKFAHTVCHDNSCVNCLGGSSAPIDSYALCDKCKQKCPDVIEFLTHCPPKNALSQLQIINRNAAAFLAWRIVNPRGPLAQWLSSHILLVMRIGACDSYWQTHKRVVDTSVSKKRSVNTFFKKYISWPGQGSNLRSDTAKDLESFPFDHSGTWSWWVCDAGIEPTRNQITVDLKSNALTNRPTAQNIWRHGTSFTYN